MSPRRAPHLLRVEEPPDRYSPLIEAARADGLRVGWLDLAATAPRPVPEALDAAARLGALRAVAVAADRSVAVKPLRGAPVLRDLLREHFRGCALVLVRGAVEAALLRPDGEGWTVAAPGEAGRRLATVALIAELRRPRGALTPAPLPAPPSLPRERGDKKKKREKREKKTKKKKAGRDKRIGGSECRRT
jgi:hypothetical protein